MVTVGIIANPASGKDIRRLIAYGSVFDNTEKVRIVRRVVLGLQAAGVDNIVFMPDYYGIGYRAMDALDIQMTHSELDMEVMANQDDSTTAARMMREMGVGAVVTLGGDGTNRAVAKGIGDVPIMALSTGTNNVFPQMVEGTVAGMAAGVVARGLAPIERTCERQLRLDILRDGKVIDIALVDAVVYDDVFIASRAVWDMTKVKQIVLTRSAPSNIGLSAVGGALYCAALDSQHGVHIVLGDDGLMDVTAPIGPGLVETVHVQSFELLEPGQQVDVIQHPSIVALDGEREVHVRPGEDVKIGLDAQGPLVINMRNALQAAAELGMLSKIKAEIRDADDCALRAAGVCLKSRGECGGGMIQL